MNKFLKFTINNYYFCYHSKDITIKTTADYDVSINLPNVYICTAHLIKNIVWMCSYDFKSLQIHILVKWDYTCLLYTSCVNVREGEEEKSNERNLSFSSQKQTYVNALKKVSSKPKTCRPSIFKKAFSYHRSTR